MPSSITSTTESSCTTAGEGAREAVLRFLRQPLKFTDQPVDAAGWLDGLNEVTDPLIAKAAQHPLRPAQRKAWEGLAQRRAGLVLGPPGTGKTHLLAWMVVGYLEACRRQGRPCRILVTAFTRNAIGNLLDAVRERLALLPAPPPIIYAGRNPPGGLVDGIEAASPKDAAERVDSTTHLILGCTVWGQYSLLEAMNGQRSAPLFDLVCVDEASQMVLAQGLMALAGLAQGGRVVVAGDRHQLPPVRIEHRHDIDERRLGSSLYAFLQSAGVPEFALEETFRLNKPLTHFPAERFYEDAYVSAVPDQRLVLSPDWREGLSSWEAAALDPDYPIVLLVHDGPAAGTSNPFETHLAVRLARLLRGRMQPPRPEAERDAFWRHRLAIVSPHRAQNSAIRAALATSAEGSNAVVETVDRIQGRERDAIILSYTVSDPEFALAEAAFLFSPNRLNVAVTRARSKLIMIVSRRLLEVVPGDQELVDAAEILREFIFSTKSVDVLAIPGPDGAESNVEVRVQAFKDVATPEELAPLPAFGPTDLPPLGLRQEGILNLIREIAGGNKWNNARDYTIAKRMACKATDIFADLHLLQRHGLIALEKVSGPYDPFWSATLLDRPRRLFEVDRATLIDRLEEALAGAPSGRNGAQYRQVRDRFDWLQPTGEDRLHPMLQELARDGAVELTTENNSKGRLQTYVRLRTLETAADVPPAPKEPLTDDDFIVLNHLEDLEVRRINFGIFEGWHSSTQLAQQLGLPRERVADAVRRLELHGHLLRAQGGRLRSRMAELARSVRYVKQRFRSNDADERPFLVRGLKVELRDRDKPERDQPLAGALTRLKAGLKDTDAAKALDGMALMLLRAWGTSSPDMAGFQLRALEGIFAAWLGNGEERFVIAADTGAGKTEAACLPLIAGALRDRLKGIRGTRAILVYPRVRLAANQAQRLTGYLAALATIEGLPGLTLGLQTGAVPVKWAHASTEEWPPVAEAPDRLGFPFFNCPQKECDTPLHITPGGGMEGADRLNCPACGWHFSGWVGTKEGLRATPPSLFLPTTESLHQWLNDTRYGALFGDQSAPPRALLADEIHLFTHVQGAQIGYALRRLLFRVRLNGGSCMAVGMSATLGRPVEVWHHLVGGATPKEITPGADEKRPSPQGRETFYFVQPEVESRGRDIAGASTTIQALMALAHGMRRRRGNEGGYRGIVFVDSIDKLKRLHSAYMDAEEGQRLAGLRTRRYADDPITGAPRRTCCKEPIGCDRFRDGECWVFAATDDRQVTARGAYHRGGNLKVTPRPVSAQSGGRVEQMIRDSDLVFATSSLEVGYDDPEMILVYQHYAPNNLASFIQRKGRGGRGSSDRPVTGVTLSIYSPRDSWYFRRPAHLLDSRAFEVPLNMENQFVVRGQAAALVLDMAAQREASGARAFDAAGDLVGELARDVEAALRAMFGADVLSRLGVPDAVTFWRRAREVGGLPPGAPMPEWAADRRNVLPWLPRTLFGTVNLPQVMIEALDEKGAAREPVGEDIALALSAVAPGNMNRRWGLNEVHWRPPVSGLHPFLDEEEIGEASVVDLGGPDALLEHLPVDAREDINEPGLAVKVLRPSRLRLTTAGRMHGGSWSALCYVDGKTRNIRPIPPGAEPDGQQPDVGSTASLRGAVVVRPDPAQARVIPPGALAPIAIRIEAFAGCGLSGAGTGLRLARVFWGSDAEVRLPKGESFGMVQLFSDRPDGRIQPIGYEMNTEGVRVHLDSDRLERFVQSEVRRLNEAEEERACYRIQMLRYIVQRRTRNASINGYEAQRVAELVVAAAGTEDLRKELLRLRKMWDPERFGRLLHRTFNEVVSQHPMLSERRIDRLVDVIDSTQAFPEILNHALDAVENDKAMASYLRSVVVHGLAIRLRQAFVLHGRGDEGRVVCHVRLPIQFGDRAEDIITVAENGDGGDGTTRTFIEQLDAAAEQLMSGFITECPNALEDAVVEAAAALPERHAEWRAADLRDPDTLDMLTADLGLDLSTGDRPLQTLLRLLYGYETLGSERFALYDLWQEVRRVEEDLHKRMSRRPAAWEVTSAAVRAAEQGDQPVLHALLAAYGTIEEAAEEDSLSPQARLADQVYRISGRLCVDGCPACLHGDSELMPPGLVEASVSRRLLERFMAAG